MTEVKGVGWVRRVGKTAMDSKLTSLLRHGFVRGVDKWRDDKQQSVGVYVCVWKWRNG